MSKIFWLHVKKSAGQSTRKLLRPYYKQVDRIKKPECFVQADKDSWNDILNNYRVPLGSYQFKRCLFAKKYLYKAEYDSLFKFAFVREPIDRCISQFFYLRKSERLGRETHGLRRMRHLREMITKHIFSSSLSYEFDCFLEKLEEARESDSNYRPVSLHFQTHTANMWDDVTDYDGKLLLNNIWRLEDFTKGINIAREYCGGGKIDSSALVHINKSTRTDFTPTVEQKMRIERLFSKDFDLYETS